MDHLTDQNMPEDLRKLCERVAAGEDPDEIKGIERLWLYRAERDKDAISASQHQFFQWLEAREKLLNQIRHLIALKSFGGQANSIRSALTKALELLEDKKTGGAPE